jgi:hypothetical protein
VLVFLSLCVMPLQTAQAQGFFDFLFGGPQRPPPAPPNYPPPPAPPIGRIAPAPLGQENVNIEGGSTGHGVAYCVRLCDGQHFPMERLTNSTPVETCRAMCPASKTKVFFGAGIDAATARDGARYADLDSAYVYRKQLVANCTCNGRDAFGVAPFDLSSDPTLQAGDIVATKDGFVAYAGRGAGPAAQYTPVNPVTLTAELNGIAASRVPVRVSRRTDEPAPADDDPGTIAAPQQQH